MRNTYLLTPVTAQNTLANVNPDRAEVPIEAVNERRGAGWDLRNAGRNYGTLVAAQAAVAAFSFASVWLVTRHLGTEGYGGVVAVIAASQVAQIFVNWTAISLARYGVEEFVRTGSIANSFWARTAIFLPNTLLVLLCGPLWLPFLAGWLKLPPEAGWLIAAHFVASASWLHVQQAMQAAKLPREQGLMLAAERVLIFVALCILMWAGHLNALSAVAAYIAAPALMTVAGIRRLAAYMSWSPSGGITSMGPVLRFSIPLIPYSLVGYFSTNYLDAIFITQYMSRADLGIYSVAYQINGIMMQLPLLAGSLLLPLFVTLQSTEKSQRIDAYLSRALPLITLVASLAAALAAVVMRVLIPAVFGEDAAGSVMVFAVLTAATAVAVPAIMGFGPLTNAISATIVSAVASLLAAATNVLGNYLLIPRYGLKGCAWATVAAYSVSMVTMLLFCRLRFGYRTGWTLPATLPAVVAAGLMSITGDVLTAFGVAVVASIVIIAAWRRSAAEGVALLRGYRAAAGI